MMWTLIPVIAIYVSFKVQACNSELIVHQRKHANFVKYVSLRWKALVLVKCSRRIFDILLLKLTTSLAWSDFFFIYTFAVDITQMIFIKRSSIWQKLNDPFFFWMDQIAPNYYLKRIKTCYYHLSSEVTLEGKKCWLSVLCSQEEKLKASRFFFFSSMPFW